jgi:hypothetical protein
MIKVVEILEISLEQIVCRLSCNVVKKVNIKSLISNHNHLNGIQKLADSTYVQLAQIGVLGEIYWPETIIGKGGETWNYDISPEYIHYCGEDVDNESMEIVRNVS